MKLLYIGYWGVDDGLTRSTVFPHLRILSGMERIQSIIFISIERSDSYSEMAHIDGVRHFPIETKELSISLIEKFRESKRISKIIKRLAQSEKIDQVVCRSSMAGSFGLDIHRAFKIPFHVESFEPHSEYMLDAGVWKIYDPRLWLQRIREKMQIDKASSIITVSNRYRESLISNGVNDSKLFTVPCAVSIDEFSYSLKDRRHVRLEHNISGVCGVYVGKFGDLYYQKEAYRAFRQAFEYWDDFSLIILTSIDEAEVLKGIGLPNELQRRIVVKCVPHNHVPKYLSASDFAFSFHKKTRNSFAFSPVKNGEYWANGLPILISEGIGDDTSIIKKERIGIVADFEIDEIDFESLCRCIKEPNIRPRIIKVANKERSFEQAKLVYKKILDSGFSS